MAKVDVKTVTTTKMVPTKVKGKKVVIEFSEREAQTFFDLLGVVAPGNSKDVRELLEIYDTLEKEGFELSDKSVFTEASYVCGIETE